MSAQNFYDARPVLRPTARTWAKHALWLLLTVFTATIAGALYPFGPLPIFPGIQIESWTEFFRFLLLLPYHYIDLIVGTLSALATDAALLRDALSFSLSLLFILTAHEFGHYIACRIYRVDATLPFFIPTPPLIGPAGTFGAFIKILSPMPSRRATFDIGVAGPIAGFVALVPVAILGFLNMRQLTPEQAVLMPGDLVFSDPLLMKLLASFFGINLNLAVANPFYAAAWLGLLVTALNLIPAGQLDGGHAVYAVFRERVHYWTGRIAFVLMVAFSIAGFYFYNSPSGLLFAILLGFMMRIGHPPPLVDEPLDWKRKLIAVFVLLIFVLSFVPFPIQIK
jgi:membrane-associated protease RseP (regulator of RpoE activity)